MKLKRIVLSVALTLALLISLTGCAGNTSAASNTGSADAGSSDAATNNDVAAGNSESGDATSEGAGREGIYPDQIADGTYTIEVTSSSSMFRIVDAQLTVSGSSMTALLTLSGVGYGMLFVGTGEEALLASEDEYIPFVENAEGKYTYLVPVEALDVETDLAAWSIRKSKWYDRICEFQSTLIPADAITLTN